MENAVSLIALTISVAAFLWSVVWSIASSKKEHRVLTSSLAEATFVDVEQMLAATPRALRFHGIDSDDIRKAGIDSGEVAYLVASFTAGGIQARATDDHSRAPFPIDSYRWTMLQSPDTRRAWPIVRKLMGPSAYRDRIDATVAVIAATKAR